MFFVWLTEMKESKDVNKVENVRSVLDVYTLNVYLCLNFLVSHLYRSDCLCVGCVAQISGKVPKDNVERQ